MQNFLSEISLQTMIAIGIGIFLWLILLFMNLSNKSKIKKLKAKYNRFMNGNGDLNIEELLETCLNKLNEMNSKNKEMELKMNGLERNLLQCLQKIGVVRYNAFENVGSDLSFSIALLDDHNDGLVLSGIYARDSSLTYAKPIIAGKSKYSLSAEEIQALDIAKKTSKEKLYLDN